MPNFKFEALSTSELLDIRDYVEELLKSRVVKERWRLCCGEDASSNILPSVTIQARKTRKQDGRKRTGRRNARGGVGRQNGCGRTSDSLSTTGVDSPLSSSN